MIKINIFRLAFLLTLPFNVFSYAGGINGYSGHTNDGETCSYCHYNGAGAAGEGCSSTATFNYTGTISTSTSVSRGTTSAITFNLNRISGTAITLGGMGARISSGTFSDTGSGLVTTNTTEASHNGTSNTPTGNNIAWTWNWTAPTSVSSTELAVCGNPTDGGNSCSDDGPHTNTCDSVTINVINNNPVASNDGVYNGGVGNGNQFLTVSESASATNTGNVLLNDSDVDTVSGGDVISVSTFSTSPGGFTTVGNVSNNGNGTFSYDPNSQFDYLETGESYVDRFRYTISDDQGQTSNAVVFIEVTGVSENPDITESSPQAVTISEDASQATIMTLNATDAEDTNSTLNWSSSAAPNGTVTVTGTGASKAIIYQPDADFNGVDSFTVTVTDSTNRTETITVNVTVSAVNDAPVISSTTPSFTINEDNNLSSSNLTISAIDVDGDTLTWGILSGFDASQGTATVTGTGANPIITYSPNANYNGSDSFTVEVSDGTVSDTVVVTATISPVADNPIITEGATTTVGMSEDGIPTAFALTLNATDAENDTLTWSISSNASNGTASTSGTGTSKAISYSPVSNFNGSDSFTVLVTDSSLSNLTDSIVVTVNVSAVNDPPIITEGTSTTVIMTEDSSPTAFNLTLNATDNENDPITWSISTNAGNGTASVSGSPTGTSQVISYTPNLNFNGSDSFIVQAEAGSLTDTITVNVTVNPINDAPIITQGATAIVNMDEDSNPIPFALTLNANDIENDTITWSISSNGSNGTASTSGTGTSKAISYSPNSNFNGSDSFTVLATDGNDSSSIIVTVNVAAINDAPVITEGGSSNISMNEDSSPVPFALTLNATDTESNTLTWSISNQANNGTAGVSGTGNSKQISYVPIANFNGNDVFTVQLTDGNSTVSHIVNLTIDPINDSPILSAISNESVFEDQLLTVTPTLNDIDANDINDGNGSITWSITNGAQAGMAISSLGVFTWTPPETGSFNDLVTVEITAQDGLEDNVLAVSQSFNITINPIDTDNDLVPDYDDFCPTIADASNADNDNDGTAGTDTSSTDTIGGDVCDSDDDNDGMPDSYENTYGFDPFDASDAAEDFDGDGVSNVDEFNNGTEPKEGSLTDITINATGYLTDYSLTPPVTSDLNSNATSIIADNYGPYRPGVNVITWTLSNASDPSLLKSFQNLNIIPIINFDVDQVTSEGETITVNASINGDAVNYPVTVDYTISGTTDSSDHDAINGSLNIVQGSNSDSITLNINNDSLTEGNETIIFSLSNPTHAILGTQTVHTVTIKEENIAPDVSISLTQSGIGEVSKSYISDGLITISAIVSDANSSQNHSYNWSGTDSDLSAPTDSATSTWSFNPVEESTYLIQLSVSDNGNPVKTTSISKLLVVSTDPVPTLGIADSDNDGVDDATEGYDDSDSDGITDYLDALDDSHLIADQTVDISNTFILQTEPGLRLKIGQTATASGTSGAGLTDEEIANFASSDGSTVTNSQDQFEHLGSVYDFSISGIITGSSAYIVIPLQVAIPKNAVYRKYSTVNGWSNFVTDGIHNQIYSAQGSLGVCPEAGSDQYSEGLGYLHNCLQLLIKDGGANDQDGIANGYILDTGVISTTVTDFEEEKVEEGGYFSYWLIFFFGVLFLINLKMRTRF